MPEQLDPKAPPSITAEKADGANDRLAERVTDKLARSGLLAGQVAPRTLRLDLDQKLGSVWGRGHVSVGELWGYLCRYPYLIRMRDRSVLDVAITDVLSDLTWELDGFALAEAHDESGGRNTGLALPGGGAKFGQIADATVLVNPDVAKAQKSTPAGPCPRCGQPEHEGDCAVVARCPRCGQMAHEGDCVEVAVCALCGRPEHDGACQVAAVCEGCDKPAHPGPCDVLPLPTNTRSYGVYRIDPERHGRDFGRIRQEILAPIAAVDGVDGVELEVTVEVQATRSEGFGEDTVRLLLENARTLRFTTYGFED